MKISKIINLSLLTLLMSSCISIDVDDYEFVDLGLSVKWATCNIGANHPEESGDYFAWGEITSGGGDFDEYKWYLHPESELVDVYKYCTDNSDNADNKSRLDLSDDAANRKWGFRWRMPTFSEMEELMTKCTWNWIYLNGVTGYNVIGPNGNSIFLPASGQFMNNEKYYSSHSGFYWTSSLHKENCFQAFSLRFKSDEVYMDVIQRHIAQTVRAVKP